MRLFRSRSVKYGEINRILRLFSKKDRIKLLILSIIQIGFSILDLIGVALFGLIGTLAVRGLQSTGLGDNLTRVVSFLHIDHKNLQNQIIILGTLAITLFFVKTLLTVLIMKKTLLFIGMRGAILTTELLSKLLSKSILQINKRSLQENIFSLTTGVDAITLSVVTNGVSILSDSVLLLILFVGLLFVDTIMAISTLLIFGLIGLLLYGTVQEKARKLGYEVRQKSVSSAEKISQIIQSYREASVKNRKQFYLKGISQDRIELANKQSFVRYISLSNKYFLEFSVIFSSMIVAGLQFAIHDAPHAIGVISVFMAASSRITPSIMRIQQSAILIKANIGIAKSALEFIDELNNVKPIVNNIDELNISHLGFLGSLSIKNLKFNYPGSETPVISDISLAIEAGSILAIVGPSGAGKTTLVDLILGVLLPDSGEILISGLFPSEAIVKWPGAIAYVPQDVMIFDGTIRSNIGIGFPNNEISDNLVLQAIKISQLDSFIESLPDGIETEVGDRGTRISGGQKQRVGIARAMFTQPRLLVLDEATSSLDGETEASISDAIQTMKGSITVIMIAHRLSTVRNADVVIYMEAGKLIAAGTFEEVRNLVPGFDRQAKLMGL